MTGFLGAGKTTLLNFVLRHPQMDGTAIVINEYGEVGLDHHLVEAAPDDLQLIANGCICCTARGAMSEALLVLVARMRQRGVTLRRVIIETTGLAEPGPIVQELVAHPELLAHFELDSVVTLVDALNADETFASHDIAVQQITAADRLLLGKCDLVDEATLSALRERLREMNPDAPVAVVHHGAAQPAQLFSGGRDNPASPRYRSGGWLAAADTIRLMPAADAAPRGGLLGVARPLTPAEQQIETFSVILDAPLPWARVRGWLAFVRTLCGPTLLRVKGLLNIENQAGPSVVHGVQYALHPMRELPAWPDDDRRTRLVFITRGAGRDIVAATLGYLQAPALKEDPVPRR
nr:GTP-binding protein [Solimonas marina]